MSSSRGPLLPTSLMSPALASGFFTTSATWEAPDKGKEQRNSKDSCGGSLRSIDMNQFSPVQSCLTLCDPIDCSNQASLSITNSRSLLKLTYIESLMPSNHLTLCHPLFSYFQSSPASGSFQMSQLFTSGGQSIGVSASATVLPMNTQD